MDVSCACFPELVCVLSTCLHLQSCAWGADADDCKCATFFEGEDQQCLPAGSNFTSSEEYIELAFESKGQLNCIASARLHYVRALLDDMEPDGPECAAFFDTWYAKLGCPECAEYARVQAAAMATCYTFKTEAECTPDAAGTATTPLPSELTGSCDDPSTTLGATSSTTAVPSAEAAPVPSVVTRMSQMTHAAVTMLVAFLVIA